MNIFKRGKTLENDFFRVKLLMNQKNYSRFGFVISAKVLKKATSRNVLKRRLRDISRFLVKDLKSNFDIIVWPKIASLSLNYRDLNSHLRALIIKE